MNSQEFCYWLQGFFELSPNCSTLTEVQVQSIRNHLNMVFVHDIDPQAIAPGVNAKPNLVGPAYQEHLQNIHDNNLKPTRPSSGTLMKC